jgi:pimeloyl-ACP methyl ester carboxylesterase
MNFLLIPGFMTDKTLWREMQVRLTSMGKIADADVSSGQSLKALAENYIALSPERFVVVGFSLGGYIARWIAALVPERIEAMILIATSNQPDSMSQTAVKRRTAKLINSESFAGLSAGAIRSSLHPSNRENKALIEFIRVMSLRLGPDVFISQLQLPRDNPPSLPAPVNFPVLIIASAEDELRTLSEAEALQGDYPASKLVVIEHAGHMLPLEQPDKLMAIIQTWLKDSALI